jgi:hypothetical protein
LFSRFPSCIHQLFSLYLIRMLKTSTPLSFTGTSSITDISPHSQSSIVPLIVNRDPLFAYNLPLASYNLKIQCNRCKSRNSFYFSY